MQMEDEGWKMNDESIQLNNFLFDTELSEARRLENFYGDGCFGLQHN